MNYLLKTFNMLLSIYSGGLYTKIKFVIIHENYINKQLAVKMS